MTKNLKKPKLMIISNSDSLLLEDEIFNLNKEFIKMKIQSPIYENYFKHQVKEINNCFKELLNTYVKEKNLKHILFDNRQEEISKNTNFLLTDQVLKILELNTNTIVQRSEEEQIKQHEDHLNKINFISKTSLDSYFPDEKKKSIINQINISDKEQIYSFKEFNIDVSELFKLQKEYIDEIKEQFEIFQYFYNKKNIVSKNTEEEEFDLIKEEFDDIVKPKKFLKTQSSKSIAQSKEFQDNKLILTCYIHLSLLIGLLNSFQTIFMELISKSLFSHSFGIDQNSPNIKISVKNTNNQTSYLSEIKNTQKNISNSVFQEINSNLEKIKNYIESNVDDLEKLLPMLSSLNKSSKLNNSRRSFLTKANWGDEFILKLSLYPDPKAIQEKKILNGLKKDDVSMFRIEPTSNKIFILSVSKKKIIIFDYFQNQTYSVLTDWPFCIKNVLVSKNLIHLKQTRKLKILEMKRCFYPNEFNDWKDFFSEIKIVKNYFTDYKDFKWFFDPEFNEKFLMIVQFEGKNEIFVCQYISKNIKVYVNKGIRKLNTQVPSFNKSTSLVGFKKSTTLLGKTKFNKKQKNNSKKFKYLLLEEIEKADEREKLSLPITTQSQVSLFDNSLNSLFLCRIHKIKSLKYKTIISSFNNEYIIAHHPLLNRYNISNIEPVFMEIKFFRYLEELNMIPKKEIEISQQKNISDIKEEPVNIQNPNDSMNEPSQSNMENQNETIKNENNIESFMKRTTNISEMNESIKNTIFIEDTDNYYESRNENEYHVEKNIDESLNLDDYKISDIQLNEENSEDDENVQNFNEIQKLNNINNILEIQ